VPTSKTGDLNDMGADGSDPVPVVWQQVHCGFCHPWPIMIRGWSTATDIAAAAVEGREPEVDQTFTDLSSRVHLAQHLRAAREWLRGG
jgi:hypothetical protein